MLFLVWYDPDARHSVVEKIQDALAAYGRRFSTAPNLVLVSADATAEVAGIEVRSTRMVQPHHFWVGCEEHGSAGVVEAEG
jgi:hypothetical protein